MSVANDTAYGHSDITYERIKENLVALNMENTLEIIDNYLEKAIRDKVNVVDVLDHILRAEAKAKKYRAAPSHIQMSGFPFRKTMEMFDFAFQPSIDKSQAGRKRKERVCCSPMQPG